MQDSVFPIREGQPRLLGRRAVFTTAALLSGAVSLAAQAPLPLVGASSRALSLCDSGPLQDARQLTFRQRTCWYESQLIAPQAAAWAAFSSAVGEWRHVPYVQGQNTDHYAHRFAAYYAKRGARETGELFAGYFHHEDPRPHTSGQTIFGKRIRSALFSVLVVNGDDRGRPALAPIAGSLASGFAGAACYRAHNSAGYALTGAGIAYSGYFGRALYQEFRPDIRLLIRRKLHKGPG
jgi:hypothetical protein